MLTQGYFGVLSKMRYFARIAPHRGWVQLWVPKALTYDTYNISGVYMPKDRGCGDINDMRLGFQAIASDFARRVGAACVVRRFGTAPPSTTAWEVCVHHRVRTHRDCVRNAITHASFECQPRARIHRTAP